MSYRMGFGALCLALASSACASGPRVMTAAERADGTAEINALCDRWEKGWQKKDPSAFAGAFAVDPDSIHVGTDEGELVVGGKVMDDAFSKALASLEKVNRYEIKSRRISFSRDGQVALLFSEVDADVVAGGKPLSWKGIRFTGVLERIDGKWQLVQEHSSYGVKPGPGNLVAQ
jgi:uncharacterized protein (TIGR02246 family)